MEFYKILKELTKDKSVTRSDICVMAVITTYAQYHKQEGQIAELSYSKIHEDFETIPIRTIQRCVKHLEDLKYIEVIRNGTQKNRYKVLIDIPIQEKKEQQEQKQENQSRQKRISNKLQCNEYDIEE